MLKRMGKSTKKAVTNIKSTTPGLRTIVRHEGELMR
jgi:hypothetical protein